MFWTSFHVLRIVQDKTKAGSLNIVGHLVAPFGRHSNAYEIVRPRPFMSCKFHDDDNDDNDDDMILLNII
jgi:hypothetical protein